MPRFRLTLSWLRLFGCCLLCLRRPRLTASNLCLLPGLAASNLASLQLCSLFRSALPDLWLLPSLTAFELCFLFRSALSNLRLLLNLAALELCLLLCPALSDLRLSLRLAAIEPRLLLRPTLSELRLFTRLVLANFRRSSSRSYAVLTLPALRLTWPRRWAREFGIAI